MNVGIVVLVIAGSLLIDFFLFFVLIWPRIQRARFLGFLQERGFHVEYGDGRVTGARGIWEDIPCEVRFNDQAEAKSSFRMELSSHFPADARVRFHPDQRGLFSAEAVERIRQGLKNGDLLEIDATDTDAVAAIFSAPDVLTPLVQLLRFQPEWTTVEDGRLCYALPISARRKNFVTWIFDQMLPVVRALDHAARNLERADAPEKRIAVGKMIVTEDPEEDDKDENEDAAPAPSPQELASSPTFGVKPSENGAQTLLVTVERTETTMGFDLPEAFQWGVTLLGTEAGGAKVRILVPRERSEAVRNLEAGTQRELAVQPATTPSTDERLNYFLG